MGETEEIQNRKRKRHNEKTCLVDEDDQKHTNELKKEYDTKSQEQHAEDNQQNYAENKTEILESIQNIVFNLTPNKEYIIKFDENENTRSEKRKRVHKTSSLQK